MVETQKEKKSDQLNYLECLQDIALLSKDLFTRWSYLKIFTCFKSPSLKMLHIFKIK